MSVAAVPSAAWASIAEVDPAVWEAMEAERHRQADKIELIASENYVYEAVNEAQGSWLTNKYAEGLPAASSSTSSRTSRASARFSCSPARTT